MEKQPLKFMVIVLLFYLSFVNNFYSQQKTFQLMKNKLESKLLLNTKNQTFVDNIKKLKTTKSISLFTTMKDIKEIEKSNLINLDLFDDGIYTAKKIKLKKISENQFLWTGKILEEGTVSIFYNNGKLTGSINTGFDSYKIEPLEDGTHILIKDDKEVINKAKCGVDESSIQKDSFERDLMKNIGPKIQNGGSPVQDLLVAYTSEVANHHGDIYGFIQTIIGDAETVYGNSDISIDLRLVHYEQINYTETEDLSVDLYNFRNNSLIQQHRNKYLSDVCVLLVDDPEETDDGLVIGISSQYGGSSYAYAVVVDDYAGSSNWTFAHEIGHIQGANHDPDNAQGYEFAYGHGFISIPGDLRTVMAYNNSNCPGGSCTKIAYFSNPDKVVSGITIGSAQTEDNSRVLGETSIEIAGFRSATLSGTLAHDEVWLDNYTLQGNITVPSGITLTIKSSATINLNSYSIISIVGTITVEGGATINGYTARITQSGQIKGYYSTFAQALSNVTSGQTIELYNTVNLSNVASIGSGITLLVKSGTTINFGSYYIISDGGTITVEGGVMNYVCLKDRKIINLM